MQNSINNFPQKRLVIARALLFFARSNLLRGATMVAMVEIASPPKGKSGGSQ